MTLSQAKDQGYRYLFSSWTRGYMSRTHLVNDPVVRRAGGKRKSLLYVDVPSWTSTRYHRRRYYGLG